MRAMREGVGTRTRARVRGRGRGGGGGGGREEVRGGLGSSGGED